MNVRAIEKKWQQRWEKAKLFEANPSKKKKFFTSLIIPYVNGNIHIGHSFTYTITDAYARYKRMQGYNTLLAWGFHATGEPILGTVERLRKGDESQLATFKLYGATDRDIENFKTKGPGHVARFWAERISESGKRIGFSVDWRRRFITAIDPSFNRFIEWQYNTLRKKGYVVQGTHPVVWCPHCMSPTGDHDRLKGEGESPIEYTILKFEMKDDQGRTVILPAATLRPETIYGVTNMWVHPDVEYRLADVNGETWLLTEEAARKLKDQLKAVEEAGQIRGKELLGKKCVNPVTRKEVPILPATFIVTDTGTGVVTSVPSHAPFDWIALRELIEKNGLDQYGVTADSVAPVATIRLEGFGEHPGKDIVEKMGIKSQTEFEKLKEALKIIYTKEHHDGVMNERAGEYAGMPVAAAKDKIKAALVGKGMADAIWELTGTVVCRCTTPNHVKILENQWFLKYSDEGWKAKVRRALRKMTIIPDEARNNFENTIEWMRDKACTRKTGLGTPLPWDTEWIVETLSDSTIYMAYYTIAKTITAKNIQPEKLTDEVFDYVFLGKGKPAAVSKKAKLPLPVLKELRAEFEYFYPVDFRSSAKELVQNHLTFYLYQHVALWPEKYWPRIIGVNGYVNVEGEKMSKSKGNIIPLKDLIEEYGADFVRLNIVSSSEGIDDADWRVENIRALRQRYDFLWHVLKDMKKAKHTTLRNADRALLSTTQAMIREATEHYERLRFRTCVQHVLFENTNALRWYLGRVGGIRHANKRVLGHAMSATVRLLAPLTPHTCEEMWTHLGKGFVSAAEWPNADRTLADRDAEEGESFIRNVLGDVEQIRKITSVTPQTISIFVSEDWKFSVYQFVLNNRGKNVNEITKEIMRGDMRKYGNATVAFIQNLYRKINELKPVLSRKGQLAALNDALPFLEKELGCSVEIVNAEDSSHAKAKQSSPQKPGIQFD